MLFGNCILNRVSFCVRVDICLFFEAIPFIVFLGVFFVYCASRAIVENIDKS